MLFENIRRRKRAVSAIQKNWRSVPMYRKKMTNEATGKTRVKYARLIRSYPWKVALALASSAVVEETKLDLSHLGVESIPESKMRPFMATISDGAVFALEQWMAATVQEIMHYAKIIREEIGLHSRNHKDVIELAIKTFEEKTAAAASGMPTATTVIPMVLARKKLAGEVEAPGEKKADEDDKEEEGEEAEGEDDEEDKKSDA